MPREINDMIVGGHDNKIIDSHLWNWDNSRALGKKIKSLFTKLVEYCHILHNNFEHKWHKLIKTGQQLIAKNH